MTTRPCRVAVTGVGLVSALGFGSAETFGRLMAGERGFGPLRLFDGQGQRTDVVAEVSGLRVADVASGYRSASWSRSDAMGVLAAREAMVQSGPAVLGERLGAVLGVTAGGMHEAEGVLSAARHGRPPEGSLERLLSYPLSTTVRRISESISGVCRTATLSSACSSGAAAIVQAAIWLEQGQVDRVIAGGVDALSLLTVTGFNALGATALEACRPFDSQRAGLTLGEGAGFLVLETETRARRRRAPVLAVLTGWALGAEAHHLTQPEPTGATAARLMRAALHRAGLRPEDVDYVNAHGTGTIQNDAMEARALREVFGSEIGRTLVSSSKGQLGHTLGAAGAVEAVITVLAVSAGGVPPTGGLQTPDPELGLRHVMGTGHEASVTAAFSNSFGFGGTGSVLVFVNPQRIRADNEEAANGSRVGLETSSAHPRGVKAISSAGGTNELVVTAVATVSGEGVGSSVEVLRLVSASQPSDLSSTRNDHDPLGSLDPLRSRRFDRAAAFVTLGVQSVLGDARPESTRVGLASGSAFGNVRRTIDFLSRVAERGARFANPAEFPHLLPSSAPGNASIYLGIQGPVVSVAELDTSAEAALAVACDWVRSGLVDEAVSGSVEPYDDFVAEILGPLCSSRAPGEHSEGAAWLVVGSAAFARQRGATILAALTAQGQCLPTAKRPLHALPAPSDPGRGQVLICGNLDRCEQMLAESPWAKMDNGDVIRRTGAHEGAGGFALAAAALLVGTGQATEVLVLACGAEQVRWSLFGRPARLGS